MATPKIRLKNKLFIKTSTSFSLLALLLACFTSALFSQEYLHINLLAICVSERWQWFLCLLCAKLIICRDIGFPGPEGVCGFCNKRIKTRREQEGLESIPVTTITLCTLESLFSLFCQNAIISTSSPWQLTLPSAILHGGLIQISLKSIETPEDHTEFGFAGM